MNYSKKYRIALIVSLSLHLLFFAVLGVTLDFNLFAFNDDLVEMLDDNKLIFELEDRKWPKEIVETPEDAKVEEHSKDAMLASDKNALASNPETNLELPLGEAFSRGDMHFRELPIDQAPIGEQGILAKAQNLKQEQETNQDLMDSESTNLYTKNDRSQDFDREYLTNPKTTSNPGSSNRPPKPKYNNQNSRAPISGGFSFNTYNWDFAPYMLALKKKVERNIFPPPAFYLMGMISGETLLRFKILSSGKMKDLEVLEYKGHETLMETSVRAIEVSAPFLPLPANFPEAYLEITATFHYFANKD
ncbi:MAG: energy transducer TonB [bacterium]